MNPYHRKPGMLPKSPSVPDFHGSSRARNFNVEMKRNASPMLPSWVATKESMVPATRTKTNSPERPSNLRVDSTYLDDDGNLSFIDLYGDEVISRKIETNDENDNDNDPEQCDYEPLRNGNGMYMMDYPSCGSHIGFKSNTTLSNFNLDTTTTGTGTTTDNDTHAGTDKSEIVSHHYIPTQPKKLMDCKGLYDRYGFKKASNTISPNSYDQWWANYGPYCQRRNLKWRIFLEKHKIQSQNDNTIPTKFPERTEKLKRYVRKGIPANWRGNAWWYFARGDTLLSQNIGKYESLVKQVEAFTYQPKDKKHEKIYTNMEIIERDLNRTFPDNIYFQKEPGSDEEPEMISALRRVLVAFSIYNPKIGYCQSMNFLAGLLLLFLEEEKAFWMLVIITSRYLPGVHDVSLEGVNIDQGVLMLCIREYLPDIWKTIKSTCEATTYHDAFASKKSHFKNEFLFKLPPITLCTVSWFMSCFIGIVPIETTLRIWDCLFYEGSHFLFKISLAIFKICEHELLHKRHQGKLSGLSTPNLSGVKHSKHHGDDADIELFQLVQSLPKTLLDPNDLFERSIFKRIVNFNSLEQGEIDRCRKYVMNQRKKYKDFVDIMNKRDMDKVAEAPSIKTVGKSSTNSSKYNVSISSSEESIMTAEDLSDVLMRETYGFKRTLTNVSWNNIGLKGRVGQFRKKKDR